MHTSIQILNLYTHNSGISNPIDTIPSSGSFTGSGALI